MLVRLEDGEDGREHVLDEVVQEALVALLEVE